MSKKCTPLWREAHLKSKCTKHHMFARKSECSISGLQVQLLVTFCYPFDQEVSADVVPLLRRAVCVILISSDYNGCSPRIRSLMGSCPDGHVYSGCLTFDHPLCLGKFMLIVSLEMFACGECPPDYQSLYLRRVMPYNL